ncbi:major facilitator superfamily MFS_1 [Pseudarthrobacter chlorophenolicus A6]|uniref:Major facilitator superfamily MFS_1 n=1 Tax=Pseudarthrobacter chlorophenolicus (strain ATCC 700700 / DSM 12829 / CIP 107037 / JCM 12360 / KCTC 9906 / NCIMB 13794 / A6) TaxID=452863 RepID=B8HGP9_PSECP|nr:MFS transporter [Pseudarthrobacter chlorophenolicus]ACL41315.1 major facilitator superfamily MFS_1 [Pseudarthrobacter chlorophenolicus A6]SDQ66387.1 MFS transporter, putative metabolite:H+ symporter [Pseudarthrobacter chlorophenolicus]
MMHSNAANRLDRLPISRLHKITLIAVSFAYFFEFADINSFATTVPKLVKLWGVTINQIAYVTSLSFVGMFFGSLIASWLADRWGRKKALAITTVWFSVFSFAAVFSWDIISLGVFRVLTSAGLAAMTVVAVIYVNEIFPAAVRGKYQAYAIVIGICGTPATNLLASWVVPLSDWSWRLVYLWGAMGIVFLLFSRHLKESPRWFESKGQFDKADALLTQMEAQVTAEKGALPEPAPAPAAAAATKSKPKASYKLLLQKKYLGPTILLTVLWVTQTIGFFGYSSWAPTLLAQEGFSVSDSIFYVALTTVGAPLGSYLASLVTDRFERKWCLVVFGTTIAVCGLFYGLTFNPVLIVVFGFLVNLFERGYTALAYAYSPEVFDTAGRSLGTGVSYGLGRLSNAAGPLIIAGLYTGSGYQSVFYFIAGTWLFGAVVLAIFGPKTRPKPLATNVAKDAVAPTIAQ